MKCPRSQAKNKICSAVEQILEEFGVPHVRGIAKSHDFIQ